MGLCASVKTMLPIQLLLGYIFFTSGLVVNFLMLCSCVIWPFSRHLYRKINAHLAYSHWSQVTFLAQWWAGTEVILYMKDEDFHFLGQEHALALLNHKYDIDWVTSWIVAEKFGILGSTKVFSKKVLLYVPLIGWAWYFTETIFLKRQWDHDKKRIRKDLQRTCDYPKGYYITLLLFPEGTRYTEKKHQTSLEVCRAKGYPEMKHVLLPRTKGFVVSVQGLKGHFKSIYNCTVAFEKNGPAPTLMNIANGKPTVAHFHIERIPLNDVPSESDETCAAWLRDLFKKKDDLFDDFLRTGRFPGSQHRLSRRVYNLLMWAFWAVLLCVPLFWYIIGLVLSGSLTHRLLLVAAIVLGSLIVRAMIGVTEIDEDSTYGTQASTINGIKKSQ